MKSRYSLLGSFALLLLLGSASSFAGHICWIDKVEKDSSGLRIYFSSNSVASIFLKRPSGRNDTYNLSKGKIIKPGHAVQLSEEIAQSELNFLLLNKGDQVELMQGAHDRCTLSVNDGSAGVGLSVESFFTPHGLPAAKASAFIRPGEK